MKNPSFSGGGRRGMHKQRIGVDFISVSLKQAWQLGRGLADLYWSVCYSSLLKLTSSKSLAISSVTKAIKRNRKQLQSFVIVFRNHKQENKRKEMFHDCFMFAINYDSSSTSWELRNSVLPMLFQSGNVKDVCTSTSTIQGSFFFLLNGLQFKHVTCTSSLHSGAEKFCTTHAFSRLEMWKTCFWFLPLLPQFKDAFFCWVAFSSNIYIINIYMEMITFLMKDHMGHETVLGNARQRPFTHIECCKLQVIADLGSRILSKISTKTSTTILFHSTNYLSFI